MQLEGGPWDEIIAEKTDGQQSNPPLVCVPENPLQGQEGALLHRELVSPLLGRGGGQCCLSHPFPSLLKALTRTFLVSSRPTLTSYRILVVD